MCSWCVLAAFLSLFSPSAGLLLLHSVLRTCSCKQHQEAVKILLGPRGSPSAGQQREESVEAKPQLDLIHISQSFAACAPPGAAARTLLGHTNPPLLEAASLGIRAYAKFLLQRLACSRFVFLPLESEQAASEKKAGSRGEGELGEGYWVQQGYEDLIRQLSALQRLQDGVVVCGNAFASWLKDHCGSKGGGGTGVLRVALETLLKDSFALFSGINYGLMELIERLGKVPKEQVRHPFLKAPP